MTTEAAATGHRYRALDTYRFLAASGVVFYHFENHFQPFLTSPTHALERFQLFVDFFFVLSGFVLMHTYGGRIGTLAAYRSFLRKRLARIYPLHVATIVLFCAVGAVVVFLHVPVRDRSFFDVSLLPSNLLLIHAWGATTRAGLNIPSWSISAEWFVYLLFPLLAILVRRRGAVFALVAAIVFLVVTEAVRAVAGLQPGYLATVDFGSFRALPSFLAGMAVFALIDAAPARRIPWPLVHGFALCVIVLMLAGASAWLITALFPVLVGLIAMAERSECGTIFASRAGVLLGNASFAVYMIHTFFQVAAVVVARTFGWTSIAQLMAVATVTYVVIVVASVASYRWFEDPLRRRLSRPSPSGGLQPQVSRIG